MFTETRTRMFILLGFALTAVVIVAVGINTPTIDFSFAGPGSGSGSAAGSPTFYSAGDVNTVPAEDLAPTIVDRSAAHFAGGRTIVPPEDLAPTGLSAFNRITGSWHDGGNVTGLSNLEVSVDGNELWFTFGLSEIGLESGAQVQVSMETQGGIPSEAGAGIIDEMPDSGSFSYNLP